MSQHNNKAYITHTESSLFRKELVEHIQIELNKLNLEAKVTEKMFPELIVFDGFTDIIIVHTYNDSVVIYELGDPLTLGYMPPHGRYEYTDPKLIEKIITEIVSLNKK